MKKIAESLVFIIALVILAACSDATDGITVTITQSASDYSGVIKTIDSSKGAKEIWDRYKRDCEAREYILKNIADDSIALLVTQYDSDSDDVTVHCEDARGVLSAMLFSGLQCFSLQKIKNAAEIYALSKNNTDAKSVLRRIDDLQDNPDELTCFIQNLIR